MIKISLKNYIYKTPKTKPQLKICHHGKKELSVSFCDGRKLVVEKKNEWVFGENVLEHPKITFWMKCDAKIWNFILIS